MPVKNRVHLILGYACNHHCRYCVQELNGRPPNITKRVLEQVYESLISMAREIAPLKLRVTFFGGEPLLYLPAIKEILANVTEPNIVWKLHSNGELINEEVVELFNSRGVRFGLSHDGPNVIETRGVDVLANPKTIELFNAFEHKSIDVVLTSYTQDLYKVKQWFRHTLGNSNWHFKPAFLVNPSQVPTDMLQFNYPAWEKTVQRICSRAERQIFSHESRRPDSWEAEAVCRAIGDYLCEVEESPFIRQNERCTALHMNCAGHISMCERFEKQRIKIYQEKKGTDKDFYESINAKHPRCMDCEAREYCRGQCPVERVSLAPQQCRLLKIYYYEIHRSHVRLLEGNPEALQTALLDFLSPEYRARNGLFPRNYRTGS